MVREAQLAQYNYILVVGADEMANGTVSVRTRDHAQHTPHTTHPPSPRSHLPHCPILTSSLSLPAVRCGLLQVRTRDNAQHGVKPLDEIITEFERMTKEHVLDVQLGVVAENS